MFSDSWDVKIAKDASRTVSYFFQYISLETRIEQHNLKPLKLKENPTHFVLNKAN